MKNLRITTIAVLVAAALAVAGAAFAATSAKTIVFSAKYSGTAVTKQADNVVNISAAGTGASVVIGAGKISGVGVGDSSQRPCVPFTGTGVMKGTKGTLTFKVIPGSNSCGDEAGESFTITGKATVLKGTGKVLRAKGTLKMTGTYDRTSGAFSVKFAGTLKA